MYENKTEAQKAILIAVDTGAYDSARSMKELCELAKTAGAEVVAQVVQNRPNYESGTFMGEGKLEEIKELCEQLEADLIISDDELTATQVRNIEKITDVHTIDRTTLILDIFAARAISAEGKIQVELAQQKYRLPRLAGMGVSLSRQGGGIGTRGPGETRLETDKRHIRRRISFLEDELEELGKRRELTRVRRKKDNVTTVAIVGYTNVGKSTLLNALTEAGVLAENKLFATLDTTARELELPDGRSVLLIDTVGLISRLPHNLVEAFKSTLEEAAGADLILHIIDVSSPDASVQAEVTRSLLSELGCDDIRQLTVLNKTDLAEVEGLDGFENTVSISAKKRIGLDRLLEAIASALEATSKRMTLLLPFDKAGLLAKIRVDGKVFSEEYTADGILADVLVDRMLISSAEEYQQ